MTKQLIQTTLAPDCIISDVSGNLRIKGWELPQIAVQADTDDLELHEEEDTVHIGCRGDLEIRLPFGAALSIDSVHGDAQIKLLDELLKIGVVHGSLSLRNVAGAEVSVVSGDLSAKAVAGDLTIRQGMGDVSIFQVAGSCTLLDIQGDLSLQNVQGDLNAVARGDARVRLSDLNGNRCLIRANGDVQCGLPPDVGAKLHLVSAGRLIKVHLPEHVQVYRQDQVDIEVGDASVEVLIEAGGDIHVTAEIAGRESAASDWTDYSEQIARQVEAQMGLQFEEITRRTKEQMDRLSDTLARAGISPEETQRVVDQAMRAGERDAARAQEKMRRAQEKMERKLQEAQQKAEQKARAAERSAWARSRHTWGRGIPPPPPTPPPAAPVDQVTEEERLMILRMLEQKKISLEEAEKLLSVLEGKEQDA